MCLGGQENGLFRSESRVGRGERGAVTHKDNKISLQIAYILRALPYIRPLMLRKLLILVLALSLGTAATASEWLLPVQVEVEQAVPAADDADAPAPQHFFENLQILPASSSGLQWQQVLPDALYSVGYQLSVHTPFSTRQLLPDAVIQLNRVLFTHIMPALAP